MKRKKKACFGDDQPTGDKLFFSFSLFRGNLRTTQLKLAFLRNPLAWLPLFILELESTTLECFNAPSTILIPHLQLAKSGFKVYRPLIIRCFSRIFTQIFFDFLAKIFLNPFSEKSNRRTTTFYFSIWEHYYWVFQGTTNHTHTTLTNS